MTQTFATNHRRIVITGLILLILGVMILGRGLVALGEPPRATTSGEGLVLVAYTRGTFVFGADGASANADGTVSEVQKIFPVGKHGAVLFSGATSIQDPVERPVRQQLNILRIAKAWLDAHPEADISTASHEINAAVSQAMTTFFSQRKPTGTANQRSFSIILAGFIDGKPRILCTSYHTSLESADPLAETSSEEARLGAISTFGEDGVAQRLLRGDGGGLQKFQGEPSLVKFQNQPAEMSSQDFLGLFAVLLRASESPAGKQAHHDLGSIAPPNRFATLSLENSFSWRLPQNLNDFQN